MTILFISEKNGTLQDQEPEPNVVIQFISRLRLRKTLIICGIIILTILFLIGLISLTFYFLAKVIKYPDIYVTGNVTGNVSANLGTLGHVYLTPDFQVNIKVNV